MAPKSGPPSFDPYVVLDLKRGCNEKEIQKAYKVQCLKWHPDKNRGNEDAAQKKFLIAKEAFDLLFDKEARREFDNRKERERVRDEKQAARMAKADSERKRHMENLEKREREFAERSQPKPDEKREKTHAEKKRDVSHARASFEEIRKQLEREVNEELKKTYEEHGRRVKENSERKEKAEEDNAQLRVKWRRGDYDETRLRRMFGEYGKIETISAQLPTKKGGKQCVVEFAAEERPWGAELETGEDGDKFDATWIRSPPPIREEKKATNKGEAAENASGMGGENEETAAPEEDLSQLSFEELQERLLGGPPPPKQARQGGPSWKDEDI